MQARTRFESEIDMLLSRAPEPEPERDQRGSGPTGRFPSSLRHWSFFPHKVRTSAGVVELKPSVLDPGIYDGASKYRIATPPAGKEGLQKCLERLMQGRSGMQAALVDMTGGGTDFAGFDHKRNVHIASIGKLAVMYAAHQLRFDLDRMAAAATFSTANDLFDHAKKTWRDTQTPANNAKVEPFSGDLTLRDRIVLWKTKVVNLPPNGSHLPKLDRIFKVSSVPPGFSSTPFDSDPQKNFDEMNKLHNKLKGANRRAALQQLAALGFLERLALMVGFSDNDAAASCVEDLGFPYIASVLVQSGLWDPVRGGGWWVGGTYGGRRWMLSPLGGAWVNGTAGSLAAFMLLMLQRKLVSPTSSDEMKALIDKDKIPGKATRSPFEDGLEKQGGTRTRDVIAFSKLGLLGIYQYDLAYIERDESSSLRLKYVAVGLTIRGTTEMNRLAKGIDACVLANQP